MPAPLPTHPGVCLLFVNLSGCKGVLCILSGQRGNFPYSSLISNCQEIFNVRGRWHTGPLAYRPPMGLDVQSGIPARLESEVQHRARVEPTHPNAVWIWSPNIVPPLCPLHLFRPLRLSDHTWCCYLSLCYLLKHLHPTAFKAAVELEGWVRPM